jgi:metal-responsive CopG/Arc/MetJ family transcriptional regulator
LDRATELYEKTVSQTKAPTAETVARMADSGKDISRFFTNSGKMMKPVRRVNVDFSARMVEELDREAKDLNISRQAVIKTLVRQALDQRQSGRGADGKTAERIATPLIAQSTRDEWATRVQLHHCREVGVRPEVLEDAFALRTICILKELPVAKRIGISAKPIVANTVQA